MLSHIYIVDTMDLNPGHVLTENERDAILSVLQDAMALRDIKRALGVDDD